MSGGSEQTLVLRPCLTVAWGPPERRRPAVAASGGSALDSGRLLVARRRRSASVTKIAWTTRAATM
ncbi:hypothetical protein M885DRAFT_524308 [Pelagophyceae sp. CCMP2097]|nr:hypothetical protein M885DRAFT_524308 [Pelagophyceae sp. CCMP2097]